MEYLSCHAICCGWNFHLLSRLIKFNHMLDYILTKLVSLIDLTELVLLLWLDLISFSLVTWINWFWFLITYSIKSFRLLCSSLHLPCGRWWKTLLITFQIILLVRPRHRAKYTRTLYPYIPGSFNYSDSYGIPVGMHRPSVGIKLSYFCVEVIIFCYCSSCLVTACNKCIDIYKATIQADGILDKLKLKETFRKRKWLDTPGLQHNQRGLWSIY